MRRTVSLLFVFVAIVACGAAPGQSRSPDPAKDVEHCSRDEDCILVVGNPCSPCGGCPGQDATAMTPARLEQIQNAESYCPARDYRDPKVPPPQCSPCPSPPPGSKPTPTLLGCRAGACVTRK